jgi:chemotaxis protein MotB
MPLSSRRRHHEELNPWPGYVDALSTLLMVIIFVLLVFVLAQAFLSVSLSGRDQALERLNRKMAELTDALSLERSKTADTRLSMSNLTRDLSAATTMRDTLAAQLLTLQTKDAKAVSDRDAALAARASLAAQLSDTQAQLAASQSSAAALQAKLAASAKQDDSTNQQVTAMAAQLADARRQLAEEDKIVTADRASIQARLSDIARLTDQVKQLTALRDELDRQAKDAAARATTADQQNAATAAELAAEKTFSDSARAQIALMNQQMTELRSQLAQLSQALDAEDAAGKEKDLQIANLGQRLNVALATKVEELQRYRSDFFGRLRDVLANRPGISVVGDRFVFQSEVLFPVGSADLSAAGADQMRKLAATLKEIAAEIPPDISWVLRVDGHADKQPMKNGGADKNWELSAQRAINVVKLLVANGIPANHLAATGFGDNQPLDPADTPEAYAKNRRIELRLTDR